MERLRTYLALLHKWQRRINLVAASTLADPWRRHLLDSAQLVRLLPPANLATAASTASTPGPSIADLGSGAGFPGLVLAVFGVGPVRLIDSDSRKCGFLREAIRATEAPAEVEAARIEALPPLGAAVVTARACAPLSALLGHAARHLATDGVGLFLKGRTAGAELTEAEKTWKMSVSLIPSMSDPSGSVVRVQAIRPR
ncbi:MAG: 16S rRNA (guanine(527)-N(7))-methyltransferase RsmG [Rhodospirillales bacterium]|nr:16S rRNA (guanine(527)-N(7))-methyltransferase RsmG [Rhodospirillales bacterium]